MNHDNGSGLFANEWLAESMRVTFFVSNPFPKHERLLSLLGFVPDQINDRPAQNVRQEVVNFEQGLIMMGEAPGRIDLLYSANFRGGFQPIFQIGDVRTAFSRCCDLGRTICAKLGPVTRLAVGPIAVRQTRSEQESIQLMLTYFPTLPANADTDTEALWSIARRRPATTFRGNIFHFQKWQTVANHIHGPALPGAFAQVPFGNLDIYLLRAEIDINTQFEDPQGAFGDELLSAYQEVCDNAKVVLETSKI